MYVARGLIYIQRMIYNHFVANDEALPEKPNANALTQRG
jgi:hypothetical protein